MNIIEGSGDQSQHSNCCADVLFFEKHSIPVDLERRVACPTPSPLFQDLTQGESLHERHDEEEYRAVLSELENRQDSRMSQACPSLSLAPEPSTCRGVVLGLTRQKLQGHKLDPWLSAQSFPDFSLPAPS
jgi:hypothetical protein